jgi:small subunit ribosomal protein S20
MPQSKSCKKRVKTSAKANVRNRAVRSRITTATKKLMSATTADEAKGALKAVFSVLDRAVKSNVIHKNKAANRKSKLSLMASKVA